MFKQLWIYFLYVKYICLITVRKRPYLASLRTEVKQEELQRERERDSTGYLKTNRRETSDTERTDHKLVISLRMYTVYFPVTVRGTHSTALERN